MITLKITIQIERIKRLFTFTWYIDRKEIAIVVIKERIEKKGRKK